MPGGDSEVGVARGAALLLAFTLEYAGDGEPIAGRLAAFGGGAGWMIVLLDESEAAGGTVTLIFVWRDGFFLKSMMIIVIPASAAKSIKMMAKGVILKYSLSPRRS